MHSDDGKYVVSGSEDRRVYIWKSLAEFHQADITTGIPDDTLTDQETESLSVSTEAIESLTKKEVKELQKRKKEALKREKQAEKAKKKTEKEQLQKIAKNEPESFEAHKHTVISAVLAPIETRRLLSIDGVLVISADETGCIRLWTCTSPNDTDQSSSSEKSM